MSKLKYSNRAVRSKLSNRIVTSGYSNHGIYVRNKGKQGLLEGKRNFKGWWQPFFGFKLLTDLKLQLFSRTEPPFKILDPPLVILTYSDCKQIDHLNIGTIPVAGKYISKLCTAFHPSLRGNHILTNFKSQKFSF